MSHRYLLYFILLAYSANAQLRFRHLTVEDGLSQSSVNFVIRDKKGYYWIGTQHGLNKFDGKNIKTYNTDNTSGLSDNFILNAIEDRYGNLWFATRNNLSVYNLKRQTFKSIITDTIKGASKGHNSIWNVYNDYQGNIVFTAAGKLYCINKNELNKFNPKISLYLNRPFYAVCERNKKIYGLKNDTFLIYQFINETLKPVKIQKCNFIEKGLQSHIIQNNFTSIFYNEKQVFELKNDTLIQLFSNELKGQKINSANILKSTYLIGTDNGLYEFDKNHQLIHLYQNHLENSFSISENKVLSVNITNDDILWVGNSSTGVNYCNYNTNYFNVLKPDANKPYVAFCCYLLNDSVLLAGTNKGYDEYIRRNNKWSYHKSKSLNQKVISIKKINNMMFLGTSNGLYLNINDKYKLLPINNQNPLVFDIAELENHKILISTLLGVYMLDHETYRVTKSVDKHIKDKNGKSVIKSNYIFNTLVTNNNIYINNTMGSFCFDENLNFKKAIFESYRYKSLSDIMITKAIETPNTVWFGSLGNGIYKLKNNVFSKFNTNNGLSNNVIASIEKDKLNTIWISSNYGINSISNSNKITSYTKALSIESPEFMTNGSCSNGNNLFFCSNSGIINFNSENLLNQNTNEDLILNTTRIIKNYTDTLQLDSVFELKYTDKIISFNFCVPSIKSYNEIILSYKLIGFDTTTHEIDNGKDISFTNLPFGNYTLKVKATHKYSVWEQSIHYELIIKPPFWKQTWFIVFCSLMLIIIISIVVYYTSRIKLKRELLKMQLNQKLFEEKDRISKDLHDNIGSQISTLISGLDKISLTKKTDNAEKLSDFARQTLNELRETVWALNKDSVSLSELKNKLEELIFEIRTNYEEIKINFEFVFLNNISLNTTHALSYYRIIQENINNSLKHSNCSVIEIKVHEQNNLLNTIITDNGKGFDTTYRKKGHYGLDNMHDRASKANINYQIESQINKGTTSKISIKINDNTWHS